MAKKFRVPRVWMLAFVVPLFDVHDGKDIPTKNGAQEYGVCTWRHDDQAYKLLKTRFDTPDEAAEFARIRHHAIKGMLGLTED